MGYVILNNRLGLTNCLYPQHAWYLGEKRGNGDKLLDWMSGCTIFKQTHMRNGHLKRLKWG